MRQAKSPRPALMAGAVAAAVAALVWMGTHDPPEGALGQWLQLGLDVTLAGTVVALAVDRRRRG